ncbi:hypothetical protein O181_083726 [Austropuccinia psidii MF-1]|uniref:Uncharacterized protein n=1 Tax=Austropuccinia psidii MF-1 TaxID=1389203 RepID=A0A9Q3FV55_9BASI|nr:hypothetical protein [Austropuccinia psidii MF-1]
MAMVDEFQLIEPNPDASSRMVEESLASSESGAANKVDCQPATTLSIKAIGPRHPTIILSEIDNQHILPYSQGQGLYFPFTRTIQETLNRISTQWKRTLGKP